MHKFVWLYHSASFLLSTFFLLVPQNSFAKSTSPYCGPAVISQVYERWNINYSLKNLNDIAATHHGLTSFDHLAKDARKYKLKTLVFRNGDIGTLKEAMRQGLVIFNNRGHFSLIEKTDERFVYIYDPGFGIERYSLPFEIFKHHWDGDGLILSRKTIHFSKTQACLLSDKELKGIIGANPCQNCTGRGGPGYPYSQGNGAPQNSAPSSSNRRANSTNDPVYTQNGNLYLVKEDLNIPARGLALNFTRFYNAQTISEIEGWIPDEGAGSWLVENGEYSGQGDRTYTESVWQDFRLELDMQTVTAGGLYPWETGWVNFRYFDKNNRYYFLVKTDGQLELARRKSLSDQDPPAILASVPSGANPLVRNHFRVDVTGNAIKIWVNGNLKIDLVDNDPLIGQGWIGLEAYYSHAHFDNVQIFGEGNDQTYSFANDDNDFVLGWGWTHSYSLRIKEYSDHVTFIRENNSREIYTPNGDGTYTAIPTNTYDQLTKDGAGFTLRTKYGLIYRFDLNGQLSYIEDRNGNRTTLSYTMIGGKLRLTEIASSASRKLTVQYGPNNMIKSVTDPAGNPVEYFYDAYGHLNRVEDREDQSENYTYNLINHNLTEYKDKENNAYSYIYAYNDRVLSQKDPYGNFTHFDYNWDTTHVTNDKGEQFKYNSDPNLFLQSVVDPQGYIERTQNNENGEIVDHWDKNNNHTHFVYDGKGNVLDIEDANAEHTSYTYNAVYNFAETMTNARGYTTRYAYDPKGNLTKITAPAPLNYETRMTYNSYGLVETLTDGRQNTIIYEYNANGDLIKKTEPNNRITEYTYNNLGQVLTVKRWLTDQKQLTTTYTYDKNGRLKTATDPLLQTSNYTYWPNGYLKSVTDSLLNTTTYTYDAYGNTLSMTDDEAGVITNTYDLDNQLHFGISNLVTVTDQDWHPPTVMTYDPLNRLKTQTDALGRQTALSYDQQGNLIKRVDAKTQTTDYYHDALNRLRDIDYAAGNDVHYELDEVGNIIWIDDILGRTTMQYDAIDRLTHVNYPGVGDMNYEYDAANNRTRIIYPSGKVVEYLYNANNEMIEVQEDGVTIARYDYDRLGRRISKDLIGTKVQRTMYTYNDASQLLNVGTIVINANDSEGLEPQNVSAASPSFIHTPINSPKFQSSYSYTYAEAGNRLTMKTSEGLYNYDYDDIYQLSSVTGVEQHSYDYDAAGNRLLTDGISYVTNNLNQYTHVGAVNYTYDNNGNLASEGTKTYGYDYENRLTSFTASGITASYIYDGLGHRIKKTVNGTLRQYVYDGERTIEERDQAGAVLATYIYGANLDEVLTLERNNNTYYYRYDGLGSVVEIADAAGSVIETYRYDPYGNPLNSSSIGNPYFFTGQRYDSESGLYYYKRRHYHPTLGRFIQRDPIGFADDVNLYRYVKNNSINWVDPWGLDAYTEEQTQEFVDNAVRDAGTGIIDYFTKPPVIFGGSGDAKYDYKLNEPTSTFVVDGQVLSAAQFGNYITAYATTYNYGYWGYWGTRVGGNLYALGDAFGSLSYGDWPEYFFDDPESIKYIDMGTVDALYRQLIKSGSR